MDETGHDEVRILGANEAASSRPSERSTASHARSGTPSWDDEDEGWDSGWLAADGDLDPEGEPFSRSVPGRLGDEEAVVDVWGGDSDYPDGPDGFDDDNRGADIDSYSAPSAAEVLRFEDDESHDDGRESWSSFAKKGPRWRTGGEDFDEDDDRAVAALGSPDTRVGTLDPDRSDQSDLHGLSNGGREHQSPRGTAQEPGPRVSGRAGARRPAERSGAGSPRPPLRPSSARKSVSLGMRVGTGALLLGVFVGTLALFKTKGGVALVALVAVLGVFEFYTSLRQRGFQPAVLPGALATLLLPIAAYSEGTVGVVITVLLTTLATLLWYLFGVVRDRPAVNMAVTLLGVLYVGVLAGMAGLFLANRHGVGILVGAVIGTVVYDMVGFFVGANLGRRPLAPDISPNKTVEGLIGGVLAAFAASVILGNVLTPWSDSTGATLMLGLAIAVMAPLGDLTESMIKRDLGIKDMGSLLPGHGGVLDRVDALLFTVPAVYCIARWQGWA